MHYLFRLHVMTLLTCNTDMCVSNFKTLSRHCEERLLASSFPSVRTEQLSSHRKNFF